MSIALTQQALQGIITRASNKLGRQKAALEVTEAELTVFNSQLDLFKKEEQDELVAAAKVQAAKK